MSTSGCLGKILVKGRLFYYLDCDQEPVQIVHKVHYQQTGTVQIDFRSLLLKVVKSIVCCKWVTTYSWNYLAEKWDFSHNAWKFISKTLESWKYVFDYLKTELVCWKFAQIRLNSMALFGALCVNILDCWNSKYGKIKRVLLIPLNTQNYLLDRLVLAWIMNIHEVF